MSTLIIASICFIGYSLLIYWIVKDAGVEDCVGNIWSSKDWKKMKLMDKQYD